MSIILLLTYILRYSHREAMSQSFKRKRVLANQRSERYFSYVKKNDSSNQNRVRWFFTYEKNDVSNQRPQWCVSFAPKFLPFMGAWSLQRPLFWSCLTADIAFIMSSSTSAWLPSPFECSPQKQNGWTDECLLLPIV